MDIFGFNKKNNNNDVKFNKNLTLNFIIVIQYAVYLCHTTIRQNVFPSITMFNPIRPLLIGIPRLFLHAILMFQICIPRNNFNLRD